jgi:hypothetical protein
VRTPTPVRKLHHGAAREKTRGQEEHVRTFQNAVCAAMATAICFSAAMTVRAAEAAPAARDFAVTLPAGFGEFVPQSQTTHSGDGDIRTTNWISKAPTGEAVIVTVSQTPGPVRDPKKMITGASASLLKSVNGTVESEEPLSENPVSARLLFRSPAAFFRARLIVAGDHYYQLLYVGRSEAQRSAPAVAQLFDSFAITAPAATPPPATTTTTTTTTKTTVTTTTTAPVPQP